MTDLYEINTELRQLQAQKDAVLHAKERRYCFPCTRFYKGSQCKTWIEFDDDGIFLDITIKCPRGHEWDEE